MTRATAWIATLLGLTAISALQGSYDASAEQLRAELKKSVITHSEPLVPSAGVLRAISIGRPEVAADLLWLNAIQYFGTGNPYGNYPSLGPLLDRMTQVDERFEYPYEFGMVTLPFMKQSDIAITLGERAQKALPNKGLLTYYLATVYHLNKRDYAQAAKYYQQASTEPGAPLASSQLAGTAISRVNDTLADREAALAYWETVFENAKNDDERERAATWYAHMKVVIEIEKAALSYKEATGAFPDSITELVQTKYLPGTPKSPAKRLFVLDAETGKVSFDQLDQAE